MVEFCRRWFEHVCPIILEGPLWRIDKVKDKILSERGRSKKTVNHQKRSRINMSTYRHHPWQKMLVSFNRCSRLYQVEKGFGSCFLFLFLFWEFLISLVTSRFIKFCLNGIFGPFIICCLLYNLVGQYGPSVIWLHISTWKKDTMH
jgi:hypothetical protein